jgi:hypothetical protein
MGRPSHRGGAGFVDSPGANQGHHKAAGAPGRKVIPMPRTTGVKNGATNPPNRIKLPTTSKIEFSNRRRPPG